VDIRGIRAASPAMPSSLISTFSRCKCVKIVCVAFERPLTRATTPTSAMSDFPGKHKVLMLEKRPDLRDLPVRAMPLRQFHNWKTTKKSPPSHNQHPPSCNSSPCWRTLQPGAKRVPRGRDSGEEVTASRKKRTRHKQASSRGRHQRI